MATPVPPLKDTLDVGGRRTPDAQSQLTMKSDEINVDTDTASSPSGPDILLKLEVSGGWSGKGQHVAFAQNEAIPLEEGRFLGRGTFADVHEVICQRISIARKRIYCNRRIKIADVKRELDVLKKLSHKHVVSLLGSYTQINVLGLLLYPVAVCDLGVFLDELDENQSSHSVEFEKLMDRLGFAGNVNCAKDRLNKVYGCLANAVQYLHENDIRHKDIKPKNILLDKNDGLYITDFGLSRDTADASSSITDGNERGTYKYCAPEVARFEPRGRAADVYSLGCVFLEINTVHCQLSLAALEEFRINNNDRSYQNSPQKLREWMSKLRQISTNNLAGGFFNIVDIIDKMVSPVPSDRPDIGTICSSLYLLGSLVYFGKCCPIQRYQALRNENAKLKQESAELLRQHEVDHPAQIDRLQMDHDHHMARIRLDHDEQISVMMRKHHYAKTLLEVEVARAKDSHQEQLQYLEKKHARAMDEICGRHQIEKQAMASTYEANAARMQDQVSILDKNIEAISVRYQEDIRTIKQAHQEDISNIKQAYNSVMAKLEQDRRRLEDIQEEGHAERLSAMTEQHDVEMTKMIKEIRAMKDHHYSEVARMRQDRRDFERYHGVEIDKNVKILQIEHVSELSAMKKAHEKQLFEARSLHARERQENGLVYIPRSPDSFAVQVEVEVKNETPTGEILQPPACENGDKVVAAMENERSPTRMIHHHVTARTHGRDEVKAVEAVPRSDQTSPAPIEPPRAQDEASSAPAKEEVKPVEWGTLGYKGPGLLKSFIFQKKFFWFGIEPIGQTSLFSYLRGEKAYELARKNAAWSSCTGKGLLYFSKKPSEMAFPAGIINLSEVTELTPDDTIIPTFSFRYGGHRHIFQPNTLPERDSWLEALAAKIREAKELATSVVESEEYEKSYSELTHPVVVAITTPKEENVEQEEKKESYEERRRRMRRMDTRFIRGERRMGLEGPKGISQRNSIFGNSGLRKNEETPAVAPTEASAVVNV